MHQDLKYLYLYHYQDFKNLYTITKTLCTLPRPTSFNLFKTLIKRNRIKNKIAEHNMIKNIRNLFRLKKENKKKRKEKPLKT